MELEDCDGDETINSILIAADFAQSPFELELRYSNVAETYMYASYTVDGSIDNWGIAARLDLSWSCTAACVYLMAGYNSGELSVESDLIGDFSADANYPHWGAGFRYDFANRWRTSLEYLAFEIGEQEGIDFGTATAWRAGVGYRF